ncbi:MAG: tyrosine--tRNA ligase [Dehalococcoidales bacterium]|nr:tyrosine--tRNA ligase [Dehalococcoidales bacterium]
MESIDKQVSIYMQGSEFGDPQIKEMMAGELRQKLIEARGEERPLRIYCGYDVTAPDIHLGHTITMRKLRQFQDFGHDVTFLIGTFTTLIGDPSDRDEARSEALQEEVKKNAQTYADQAFKILDPEKTTVRYNYDWLSKLSFADVISMASCFTVQQFLTRDRLRNRYEKNDPIWLRELLYPLAQGYDAVTLQADVQIGATEQLFNLMAGRKLQEVFGQKPQVCITFPVLVGTDGVQRMSKSIGNYIGVTEPPEQIYGKVMSIPDGLIMQYFELLTDVSEEELEEFKKQLADERFNPMKLKKRLAGDIVTQLYSRKEADEAEKHFEKVVQNKEVPDEIRECPISFNRFREFLMQIGQVQEAMTPNIRSAVNMNRLLVEIGLAKSHSEAGRLIAQGAVEINGEKLTSNVAQVDDILIIKVGKRRFVKVINTDK